MAQEMMRAMAVDHFGGPENLTLHELPIPEPGPREVLIRVQFAGVGEWDPYEREGGFAEMLPRPAEFPYVLGSEGSGKVEACGRDVQGVAPGDRVYAVAFPNPRGGFYAEYAVVPSHSVAPKPAALSHVEAAGVPLAALTAWGLVVETAHAHEGQRVLIHAGSGGVGHFAVQFAAYFGAHVTVTASGRNASWLRELGAAVVVDYTTTAFEEVIADVDVVIDLVGNVHADTGSIGCFAG
jgi:NADPH:quinone reductase-like Zn-dependent oxidoreductase